MNPPQESLCECLPETVGRHEEKPSKHVAVSFPKIPKPKGLDALIHNVSKNWSLGRTHRYSHWRRVERNGILLSLEDKGEGHYALREDVNIKVVRLFAYLHDSCQKTNGGDHEHGRRAEKLVYRLRDTVLNDLTNEEIHLLGKACRIHTRAYKTKNPTMGVCLDADRLDLVRVGKTPSPSRMSTMAGAHYAKHPRRWGKLVSNYESAKK